MDKKEMITYCLTTTIALTIFIVGDIFFKICACGAYVMSSNAGMAFTVLMGLIVFTFFWAISKKSSRSTKICYSIVFVMGVINYLKILYSREPLYFSDIKFLKAARRFT